MALSSESIAAIRKLVSQQSRKEIKQLLLEAGANADRILSIPVLSNMKSHDYLTTEDILSKGFDTVYADHEKSKADEILLKLLRKLTEKGVDVSYAMDTLETNGLNFENVSVPAMADKEQSVGQAVNERIVSTSYEYDAFICHASEDKDSFVRPLANELRRRGLHVWYDEFSLRVGDSLRRSIDRGLTKSCYGIVVLSPDFFRKEWPQKELDGLTALESGTRKVILPIWHKVEKDYILKYSPILADRIAINSTPGIEHVVEELLKVVKPKNKYEKLLSDSIKKWITHDILPSIEDLYTLWRNIKPERLTLDEMTFLYYAYLSRDEEFDHWLDNGNEDFSFSYLTDHIAKRANLKELLLSKYPITKAGAFALGLSHQDDNIKNVHWYKLKIFYNQKDTEAFYYIIRNEMNIGIEVLIIREGELKSFVRYIPESADVEMQSALKLIGEKE
ncbi:MAG: toll/interleukin-1 receptor domain-containing protein [Thermodesulfovibrionales bacterium]|nr:toll/interleukin-1 receptor domain-containing protein [Thermodesulfovibrionales bacterium]